ncbi:MAG TPA: hypothetical protein VMU84_08190 [Thermoanaerobaculia bacterium]|nr:hypothetical protein [Thermoanaerobaculia bacterium]
MLAICISCGTSKKRPWARCSRCGFDPSRDEMSLVKSVYLSTERYDDVDDQERYEGELRRLSGTIREGSLEYDANELDRLRKQKRDVEDVRPLNVLFRIFLPALLFLGGLLALLLLLRYANH